VIAARLFGPAGRGELTAWTLASAMGMLLLLGPISVGLGRMYLRGERHSLVPIAWIHCFAAAVVALLGCGIALAAGVPAIPLLLVVLVSMPFEVAIFDLLVVSQAAKWPWLYQGTRILDAGVFSIGLLVLWVMGTSIGLTSAWVLFAAGSAAGFVAISVIGAKRLGASFGRTATVERLRDSIRMGRGSYWANLLDPALHRCAQFVVVGMLGRSALGIYVVAVNWAEIALYLGHAIGQAAFEEESTLGRRAAVRLLSRSAVVVGLLTLVVAVLGFVLVEPIFGEEFASARWVLLLLAPGLVARTVGYTGGQIMMAQGRAPTVARILALSFAIAVPLWVFGAWAGGIEGVALASTVVYALQMVLIAWQFRVRATPPAESVSTAAH